MVRAAGDVFEIEVEEIDVVTGRLRASHKRITAFGARWVAVAPVTHNARRAGGGGFNAGLVGVHTRSVQARRALGRSLQRGHAELVLMGRARAPTARTSPTTDHRPNPTHHANDDLMMFMVCSTQEMTSVAVNLSTADMGTVLRA